MIVQYSNECLLVTEELGVMYVPRGPDGPEYTGRQQMSQSYVL
jgi:hypothetical protein